MNSTFMFDEDRFSSDEDFSRAYRGIGGTALAPHLINDAIRSAFAFLNTRYHNSQYQDDFPTLAEALAAVAPQIEESERSLLVDTFAAHERGRVPPAHAAVLQRLNTTHELRLLTNIWAPKQLWLQELQHAGVLSCFTRTIFSSDTRSVKPSPLLMEKVLEGIACERHAVLIIGDSLHRDMLPGRRAGLMTLWISSQDHVSVDTEGLVDYRLASLTDLMAV